MLQGKNSWQCSLGWERWRRESTEETGDTGAAGLYKHSIWLLWVKKMLMLALISNVYTNLYKNRTREHTFEKLFVFITMYFFWMCTNKSKLQSEVYVCYATVKIFRKFFCILKSKSYFILNSKFRIMSEYSWQELQLGCVLISTSTLSKSVLGQCRSINVYHLKVQNLD